MASAPKGYTGGLSIGGATFTLGIDDGPLKKGLDQAAKNTERSVNTIRFGIARINTAAKEAGTSLERSLYGGSNRAAQGLLQLGYAVDDLQYGMRAIVNNIPQLAIGLTGSAGIAGAAAIAAVAISQLAQHWGQLTDMFESAWSGKPLSDLAKIREESEAAADAWDRMSKKRPKAEMERAGEVEAAMVEYPIDKLENNLKKALKSAWDKTARPIFRPEDEEELTKRAHELAGKAALPGAAGEKARGEIRGLYAREKKSFPEGHPFKTMDERNQRELERFDAEIAKSRAENMAEAGARARKKQSEQAALEIEGRENAKRFERDRDRQEEATARRLMRGPAGIYQYGGASPEIMKRGLEAYQKQGAIPKGEEARNRIQKQMKEISEEDIKERMQEKGLTREGAQRELRQEAIKRNLPAGLGQQMDETGRPQTRGGFVGAVEFSKQIQEGALSKDNVPKQQLTAQQKMAMLLERIDQNIQRQAQQPNVAVAGNP